jgi:hypothetical protein
VVEADHQLENERLGAGLVGVVERLHQAEVGVALETAVRTPSAVDKILQARMES